jgi:hypothetical protein
MLTEGPDGAARRIGVTRRTNKSVDNSVGKIRPAPRARAGNADFTLVKDKKNIRINRLGVMAE